jgi:hypothetical protein
MKTAFASLTAIVFAAAAAVAPPGAQRAVERTFDAVKEGAPPADFTFAAIRQATPGNWLVRKDAGNAYLAHLAQEDSRGSSLAIAHGAPFGDVVVSARVRLLGGSMTGGVISRYHDDKNYYATMLDLRRGQLRMYRVFEGNYIRIETKDDLQLDASSWHTLKVVHRDNSVYAYLGGIRVFEDRDSRNRAFAPGRCGVIAAGDAEAWFDDVRIDPEGRNSDRTASHATAARRR